MPEANEVETLETTDTAEEQEQINTGDETDNETSSDFDKAFNLDAYRDEAETSENQNSNETQTENENNETTDEQESNTPTVIKFKSGDSFEEYDITKEEDKKKLDLIYEFGKNASQKLGEVNQKESTLKGKESQLEASSELILNQYLKNVVQGIEIVEKPELELYLDEVGDEYEPKKYKSKEEAKTAYKNDSAKYEQITELKNKFRQGEQEATKKYSENLNKFVEKYPEYKDTAKFNELLKSKVQPIYNALTSMGSVALPEDFFDMVHFHANKDKIIQDAIANDRKKRLSNNGKVQKPVIGNTVKQNTNTEQLTKSDKEFKQAFNLDKYK